MNTMNTNTNKMGAAITLLSDCIQYHAGLIPGGFEASPDAPGTFPDVLQNYQDTGKVVVYDGDSDDCIFPAAINIAFRAWHDHLHITLNQGFNLGGEYAVLLEHQALFTRWFYQHKGGTLSGAGVLALELLRLEIYAQRQFYAARGAFVKRQGAFNVNMYHKQQSAYATFKD